MEKKIILLADDDRDDTDFFCEALADIDPGIACNCAGNGAELLKKLEEMPEKPGLIFLDLNMPVMNGWQCLKILKTDGRYRHIPVIMISTSSHGREITIASDLGALCYFVKPHNFNEFKRVLRVITANLGAGLRNSLLELEAAGSKHIFVCKAQ